MTIRKYDISVNRNGSSFSERRLEYASHVEPIYNFSLVYRFFFVFIPFLFSLPLVAISYVKDGWNNFKTSFYPDVNEIAQDPEKALDFLSDYCTDRPKLARAIITVMITEGTKSGYLNTPSYHLTMGWCKVYHPEIHADLLGLSQQLIQMSREQYAAIREQAEALDHLSDEELWEGH